MTRTRRCASAKAALLGAIPPFLLKTDDNPEGVDQAVFDGITAAVIADRPAYFKDFLDNFYNVDQHGSSTATPTASSRSTPPPTGCRG